MRLKRPWIPTLKWICNMCDFKHLQNVIVCLYNILMVVREAHYLDMIFNYMGFMNGANIAMGFVNWRSFCKGLSIFFHLFNFLSSLHFYLEDLFLNLSVPSSLATTKIAYICKLTHFGIMVLSISINILPVSPLRLDSSGKT